MRLFLRSILVGFLVLCLSHISTAQCLEDSLNMINLYNYEDPSQPGIYNDVWGYVDPAGNEYGIIGAGDSTLIFDVTDEANIYKVGAMPGTGICTWRDMKTYDEYLYVVTDCGEGLRIYDLSTLPSSFPEVNQVTADFSRAHNIYIEEATAKLYVVGSVPSNDVLIIYDLAADPENPTLLQSINLNSLPGEASGVNYYIHDIFVKNDTAYCSHGYLGYAIWDVSDVNNINRVSDILPLNDGADYVHSSWNVASDSIAYVATEIGDRQIYIVDQKDKTDIDLDTIWKEPLLESCGGPSNNVPHNPYVHDNILYISYYEDGVQMLDISDPRKPTRMGFYDTNPNNTIYAGSGTKNNWGVYPFLPSGIIIGSDTRFGFFALKYQPPTVPIVLRDFNVKLGEDEKSALISWSIASATNVEGFEVQRSSNGADFSKLKGVDFDRYTDNYKVLDEYLTKGSHYYRLKTIDFDGSFSYSETRKVYVSSNTSAIIYPAVSTGILNLEVSQKSLWNYSIFNTSGQQIKIGVFDGDRKDFDFSNLPSGMYYMSLNDGIEQFQTNFIIAH